jgi:hypothetical protein
MKGECRHRHPHTNRRHDRLQALYRNDPSLILIHAREQGLITPLGLCALCYPHLCLAPGSQASVNTIIQEDAGFLAVGDKNEGIDFSVCSVLRARMGIDPLVGAISPIAR